jgi:homoserine kinase
MKKVTISVPATSANLGPGFDCMGLALGLYNTFTFTQRPEGLEITVNGEGAEHITLDHTNLVAEAAIYLFRRARRDAGFPTSPLLNLPFHIHIENNVPVMSGLGSSSTAVMGGLLGANAFLDQPYTRHEILTIANDMEGHPDNVTPALLGGMHLIVDDEELVVHTVNTPISQAIVVLPDMHFPTAEARSVIPKYIPMKHAIFNASRLGLLIRAFQDGDYERLRIAMQDRLHQPYRLPLIPGAQPAIDNAHALGAAVAMSGAGPSLIAFVENGHDEVAAGMMAGFKNAGISARHWLLPLDQMGSQVTTT